MSTYEFSAVVVRKSDAGDVSVSVEQIPLDDLPPGDVLIAARYSSLNYKDALACEAHPGVVAKLPHVPGIDVAGTVEKSDSPQFSVGDEVIVTGYELGAERWGGYSQFVRVPAEWVVPKPAGLSLKECMTYGTAGFTAAQCVAAMVQRGIEPESGEVVVSGATGGVGSIAVAILAKLGYRVAAVTGKRDRTEFLHNLGAQNVLPREEVDDQGKRPLLSARWAAAVDTVGGNTLATILRQMQHRGCVAACGLVGGDQLPLTVYPFILRGVTLAGIDSAKCPMPQRLQMWQNLAGEWQIDQLADLATEIPLEEIPQRAQTIRRGEVVGRTVVVL